MEYPRIYEVQELNADGTYADQPPYEITFYTQDEDIEFRNENEGRVKVYNPPKYL